MSVSRRALLLVLGSAFVVGCTPNCSCQAPPPAPEPVTIYIVRHAEKEAVPADADEATRKDPPLSQAGKLRALALPDDLPVEQLDAVYVTRTKRSHDTASAVLAVTGLEPIAYPPQDTAGLVERLRGRRGQHVLIVGHSNTIPELLAALGVTPEISIPEDQYGDMWVVELREEGASLELRRFGESGRRFEPR